jgi:DNA-binding response OmpR family regulator
MRVLVVEDERGWPPGSAAGWPPKGSRSTWPWTAPTACGWPASAPYDVIVLDIMLPGVNGYRLCSACAATATGPPILMLTAKEGELDEVEALDSGAETT